MDQVTPALSLRPGVARRSVNWECDITGGYTRIAGYERYDGRARPSDATYAVISVASATGFAVGQAVTSGGASGKIIAISGLDLIVTRLVGEFVAGATVVSGAAAATVTLFTRIVSDGQSDALYKHLAANDYRASIGVVPGSGPILGVAYYAGKVYAWRNNAGGTAAVMYGSSATGWQAVTLFEEVPFSNANASVNDGDTLTQGAVTALIRRVVVRTGTLASGTNTGVLVVSNRTGGSFSAASATSTGGGTLTLGGAQTAITFAPNGKFNGVVANFGGGPANRRLYVADGVNRAFEFDGTTVVPISTGMSPDAPKIAVVHKQTLFLSFGYSLQFSAVGNPYSWSPVLGAGEIALNSDITALIPLPGDQTSGALAIFTKDATSILYGTPGTANLSLSSFSTASGAAFSTAQNLEQTYAFTPQGVTSLAASQNFGNFTPSSLTAKIQPFVRQRSALASASGVNRERGQYRVFFSDGSGLYLTLRNGEFLGAMPVQYPDPVLCMCEGERADGSMTSYFGSSSGYVFEADAGTSFDGQEIVASAVLVFNAIRNSRVLKRYRKASLEVYGQSFSQFSVGYDLGYGSQQLAQAPDAEYASDLRAGYWDSMSWDNFVWDGAELSPTEVEVVGTAENIAVRVASSSAAFRPFTINSVTLHYTPRRGIR